MKSVTLVFCVVFIFSALYSEPIGGICIIYSTMFEFYFFPTDDFYGYEWQDEHGHWNPYLPDAVITLEEAHSGGEKSVAMGRDYTVDN